MSTKKKGSRATLRPTPKRGMPKAGHYPMNGNLAVTAPSAVSTVMRKQPTNPVRIQQTEEASSVICQADFENSAFLINPGNEDLFPWLAPIATQFTTFEWNSISHKFVANSDTATSGTVIMAVNADPSAPPFSTEKEILNHMGSATAAPWTSFEIDGKSKSTSTIGPRKFVEDVTGVQKFGSFLEDVRTVATGVLNVATLGLALSGEAKTDPPAPKVVGKLFTTYDVTLWDPVDETASADEGISFFTCADVDPASDTKLFALPTSFEGQEVNPLRINTNDSDTNYQVASHYPTEAGIYEIQVVLDTTTPFSLAGMVPFLGFDPIGDPGSGIPAPTLLYGTTAGLTSDGMHVQQSGIWQFPVGNDYRCRLNYSLYGVGTSASYDYPNCGMTWTQVSNNLSVVAASKLLPKGRRGCTPDCPRSAVFFHLRETLRSQKQNGVMNAVTAMIKPTKHKAPDEKSSGKDEKSGVVHTDYFPAKLSVPPSTKAVVPTSSSSSAAAATCTPDAPNGAPARKR